MRILVDVNHPAHVHFFKYFIWEMERRNHEVLITASSKDITFELLEEYGFNYVDIGKYGKTTLQKMVDIFRIDAKLLSVARTFKPDILLGIASFRVSHIAFLMGRTSYIFDDTEHSTNEIRLYKPFATKIITPQCFTNELGPKHIRYNGFHELAYLHPNHFTPNPGILNDLKLTPDDTFFIVRFVSWDAGHDAGQKGFSTETKRKLVDFLKEKGRVIITSESPLPEEFEPYRISVSPTKMHDLLYYATMYIGEGGTMASEAAVLGTPSIFVNSLTMGYLQELERHGLLICPDNDEDALQTAMSLLKDQDLKSEWRNKLKPLNVQNMDVTQWMLEFVE